MPLYSGCSLKCFVIISFSAVLAACCSVGSRTSHVAKHFLQKYWHGMPDFLNSSSNLRTKLPHSAVTVRICIIVRSRNNLHTCKLPLAGSRSPLVKYARGSHIGCHSTSLFFQLYKPQRGSLFRDTFVQFWKKKIDLCFSCFIIGPYITTSASPG